MSAHTLNWMPAVETVSLATLRWLGLVYKVSFIHFTCTLVHHFCRISVPLKRYDFVVGQHFHVIFTLVHVDYKLTTLATHLCMLIYSFYTIAYIVQ